MSVTDSGMWDEICALKSAKLPSRLQEPARAVLALQVSASCGSDSTGAIH